PALPVPHLSRQGRAARRPGGAGVSASLAQRAALVLVIAGLGVSPAARRATNGELQAQVRAAETAFAKTMADRDPAAFAGYVADEAVFFGRGALRGKAAVVEGWKPLYEGPK